MSYLPTIFYSNSKCFMLQYVDTNYYNMLQKNRLQSHQLHGTQGENRKKSIKHSKQQIRNRTLQKAQAQKQKKSSIIGKPWSELQVQIRPEILQSLISNNYNTMFPVQEAAIPLLLKNYDLAVEAQTGSGKTISFLVPLLQKYLSLSDLNKLQEHNDRSQASRIKVRFLLISPTRQLCQQSYNCLVKLLQKLPNKQQSKVARRYCHCATGGREIEYDFKKIEEDGVYVLMGTVGRLRELGQKIGEDWLKKVDYLFIDQADRVLKEKGIEELIKSIQKLRRTAMFSATLQGLMAKHFQFYGMRNLAKISLKAIQTTESPRIDNNNVYVIPKSLHNTYISMHDRLQKMRFLINFLKQNMDKSKIIVFLSTCACVDYYLKILTSYFQGNNCIHGIHGKLKSKRRKRIIEQFMGKESGVLFATDVVSRGIDFQHIHFILQVDPPEDPDNYIHRIGRTARVNRPGTAILLIEQHESAFITFLAGKGVGVQKVQQVRFTRYQISIQSINQRMFQIIGSDRDNVQKGKRAFVSYIRAYKEHDLKYIFQFKNIDIGMVANSFFLFRIPRIKEILGKNFSSFTQSQIDIQSIPWVDKNQQSQFMLKQQKREEERAQRQSTKQQANIKNKKSRRKKVHRQNMAKQMQQMNRQHNMILKQRKLGNNQKNIQIEDQEQSDEDTQQIEARVAQRQYARK